MKLLLHILIFALYIGGSCLGLYFLKSAHHWLTPTFAAGAILYVCGALTWLLILRLFPLSMAFPIAAGSLMIGTSLIGHFFLNEAIDARHLVGVGMIVAGIALLASKAA